MSGCMNIAVAANEAFFKYLYVMLTSLLENNKSHPIRLFLLSADIGEAQEEQIGNLVKKYGQDFCFMKIDKSRFPKELPVNETITLETYFRFALIDLLPAELERILYLDVDVIVNKSLHEFYEMDFEDNFFCVCRDVTADVTERIGQSEVLNSIRAAGRYFNAGILLFNLKKLRESTSFSFLMQKALEMKDELTFHDQDLLNCVFRNAVKYADPLQYNLIARTAYNAGYGYQEVKENVTILHYAGSKPWDYKDVRYALEEFWWEYAKMTPYYTEFLERMILSEIRTGYMERLFRDLKRENDELEAIVDRCMNLLKSKAGGGIMPPKRQPEK